MTESKKDEDFKELAEERFEFERTMAQLIRKEQESKTSKALLEYETAVSLNRTHQELLEQKLANERFKLVLMQDQLAQHEETQSAIRKYFEMAEREKVAPGVH